MPARVHRNDVRKILIDFNSKQVNGLVIDLRNNGVDFCMRPFNKAIYYADQQFSYGLIMKLCLFNMGTRRAWNKPVVVLVNKFSASTSEIFAGALPTIKH